MLSNSMKQLKIVQARFAESKESLSQMTAENSGNKFSAVSFLLLTHFY